jgi:hypothetical protein
MSRKLMLVCGTLLTLALAILYTGDTARGQGVGSLVAITAEIGPIFAVDAAGNIYKGEGCYGNLQPFARIGQIPGGHTPTCIGSWNNGQALFVGCSDGDIYSFSQSTPLGFTAGLCGNVFGGAPTTAIRSNWGSLKARYR